MSSIISSASDCVRGDHLARVEQDADEVGRRAVQLRARAPGSVMPRGTTISPSGTGASTGVSTLRRGLELLEAVDDDASCGAAAAGHRGGPDRPDRRTTAGTATADHRGRRDHRATAAGPPGPPPGPAPAAAGPPGPPPPAPPPRPGHRTATAAAGHRDRRTAADRPRDGPPIGPRGGARRTLTGRRRDRPAGLRDGTEAASARRCRRLGGRRRPRRPRAARSRARGLSVIGADRPLGAGPRAGSGAVRSNGSGARAAAAARSTARRGADAAGLGRRARARAAALRAPAAGAVGRDRFGRGLRSAAGAGSGSGSGTTSRRRPFESASRRTRSADGSSMLDEWLFTPILSSFESSTTTSLSTPSSRASS